jgi:hypothetical protein
MSILSCSLADGHEAYRLAQQLRDRPGAADTGQTKNRGGGAWYQKGFGRLWVNKGAALSADGAQILRRKPITPEESACQ